MISEPGMGSEPARSLEPGMGSASVMPANLGDLLARAGSGKRLALVDLRRPDHPVEMTADDVDEHLRAFARGLRRQGIEPGQRVGFLAENRWEMLIGYLATMFAGAVAVPVNHKLAPETVNHIVADAELSLIFHDDARSHLVPDGIDKINFDDPANYDHPADADDPAKSDDPVGFAAFVDPGPMDAFDPVPGDLAEILYTSGSTGMPKGVPLDHLGQLWALEKYLEPVKSSGDVASGSSLIVAPLFHMNAIMFSGVCLLNALTVVLQPRFDAAAYISAVERYRCTFLSGVPTMFAMVAALDEAQRPLDLRFVERVMIGSAPLSDALIEQVRSLFPAASLANGYGTTEAGPAVFGPHPERRPRPTRSIGYPFDDIEWRLVDGPSASEGELEVRTTALTSGYLNRPEANRERFVDGWYRTGDIMRHDDEGFFYFVSRADDMFVCGGENIHPGEVEKLLNTHPGVQQSLVVGAPDDLKGMVPVAFVVATSGVGVTEDELKTYALERAPAYLHPRRVVFRTSLPVGGTQKIDRRSLETEARELMIAAGRTQGPE